MPDHVYKLVELVGTSQTGIEDAVEKAISRAGKSLRHLGWFEITDMRGQIADGKIAHYQVTLKAGFSLEG